MSMNDPLGDMLARIRNAQNAKHKIVQCPHSRLHEKVCDVLKDEGYIRGYKVEDIGNNRKVIEIQLKYAEGEGVIRQIDRVSTPGRRIYTNVKDMPRFYNGLGILVVSTPQGVLPDYKARAANVGGEILCRVF
ncbi:MAG: 30S ribosomal protein S8 [Rhodospirillales bacterium]|nr:30S ribosomal protein S8 [Alphaproteobacteria bacterium]MCB1839433.1 30S ribosomal protein S8 [Alphaproteobacteria bacterium]MCB9977732.1 30S ribosomal protein S8 [Rhodospirillales bacterium]